MKERKRSRFKDHYLDLAEQALYSLEYAETKVDEVSNWTIREEIADRAKASVVQKYPTDVDGDGVPIFHGKAPGDAEKFAEHEVDRIYKIRLHRDLYTSGSHTNAPAWEELAAHASKVLKKAVGTGGSHQTFFELVKRYTDKPYETEAREIAENQICTDFVYSKIWDQFLVFKEYSKRPERLETYLNMRASDFIAGRLRQFWHNKVNQGLNLDLVYEDDNKTREREFVDPDPGTGFSKPILTPEEELFPREMPRHEVWLYEALLDWIAENWKNRSKPLLIFNLLEIGVVGEDGEAIVEEPTIYRVIDFLHAIQQDDNKLDEYFALLNVDMSPIGRERILDVIHSMPKNISRAYIYNRVSDFRRDAEKEFRHRPEASNFFNTIRINREYRERHPNEPSKKDRNESTSKPPPIQPEGAAGSQNFPAPSE